MKQNKKFTLYSMNTCTWLGPFSASETIHVFKNKMLDTEKQTQYFSYM